MFKSFAILSSEKISYDFYMSILHEMKARMHEPGDVYDALIATETGNFETRFYTEKDIKNFMELLEEEDITEIQTALSGEPKSCVKMSVNDVGDSEVLAVRFAASFIEKYPCVVFSYFSEGIYTAEQVLALRDQEQDFVGGNNLAFSSPAEREARLERLRSKAKDEVARAEVDSLQVLMLMARVEIPEEFYWGVLEEMHAEKLTIVANQIYEARVAWATGSFRVFLAQGELAENALSDIYGEAKIEAAQELLGGKPQSEMWVNVTEIGDSMVVATQFLARFAERSLCIVYDEEDRRVYSREEVLRLRDEQKGFVGKGLAEKREEAEQKGGQGELKKDESRGWESEGEGKGR